MFHSEKDLQINNFIDGILSEIKIGMEKYTKRKNATHHLFHFKIDLSKIKTSNKICILNICKKINLANFYIENKTSH